MLLNGSRGDHDDEFVAFTAASMADLRRTGYLICGDWHRAEDAVQEALVRVYRGWRRIERRESVLAYTRKTLVRVLVDESRRPWRREHPTSDALAERRAVAGPETGITDRAELAEALASLPPRRRACVVLRHYHDLPVADTARILGCSEGTVKSQTHLALRELRVALDAASLVESGGRP